MFILPSTKRILRVVGTNLRNTRRLMRLTLKDVAGRARVTDQTISNIEHGKPANTAVFIHYIQILGLQQQLEDATDPYKSEIGILRSLEKLPKKVRHSKEYYEELERYREGK